jgi:hypothetical protein
MGFANLAVKDWGGLVIEADQGAESVRGAAAATADVPVGLRRRMPKFALAAVRCAVGVARPGCELVFASRFGDVTTALNLSEAIVAADLLSPSAFSACVHNAAPGLAAQVLGEHASHTACLRPGFGCRPARPRRWLCCSPTRSCRRSMVSSSMNPGRRWSPSPSGSDWLTPSLPPL